MCERETERVVHHRASGITILQNVYKWVDTNWRQMKRQRLWFWIEECNFSDSCKHLSLASPPLSLCPSISEWNFPAVWKSQSIVTAQPGVSQSIPLTSHAAQTHKHTCINTCTYTQMRTLFPRLKGSFCLVARWEVTRRGPAMVFVYFSYCSMMEALGRHLNCTCALMTKHTTFFNGQKKAVIALYTFEWESNCE